MFCPVAASVQPQITLNKLKILQQHISKLDHALFPPYDRFYLLIDMDVILVLNELKTDKTLTETRRRQQLKFSRFLADAVGSGNSVCAKDVFINVGYGQ